MASFDTLIRPDTLTFSSSSGSNRHNEKMEVKIQYENTSNDRARDKESLGIH